MPGVPATSSALLLVDQLPPEEQSQACVLAGNYGEAGAIDFFGEKHGLPKAINGHNSYYLWGPRGCNGETVVAIGVSQERLEEVFSAGSN
jgi:hypothetical protein